MKEKSENLEKVDVGKELNHTLFDPMSIFCFNLFCRLDSFCRPLKVWFSIRMFCVLLPKKSTT